MKTTQDIINEAAEKRFPRNTKNSPWHYQNKEQVSKQEIFTDGATFALSTPELWREGYKDWAAWLRVHTVADGAPKVIYKPTMERKTTDELFDLYIQQLSKQ